MEYLEILGQHKFESELVELEKDPQAATTGWRASLSTAWKQWSYLFQTPANRKRVLVGGALYLLASGLIGSANVPHFLVLLMFFQ
jgi:hypothetical protein